MILATARLYVRRFSAICAAVPKLLGPRGPGAVGRTYGVDAVRA